MIEIDPLTGAIKVNTNKAPGTYLIRVIGTLTTNLTTTINEIFTITIVPNELP